MAKSDRGLFFTQPLAKSYENVGGWGTKVGGAPAHSKRCPCLEGKKSKLVRMKDNEGFEIGLPPLRYKKSGRPQAISLAVSTDHLTHVPGQLPPKSICFSVHRMGGLVTDIRFIIFN